MLIHLGEIFVGRNAALWARDETLRWAAAAAKVRVVGGPIASLDHP